MTQYTAKNTLDGSMMSDPNPSKMGPGDYIEARNMRIGYSQDGNMGCGETIKGTLEIPNPLISDMSGRYMVIGAATYEAGALVYYFMMDTRGSDHGIYEFNLLSRSIRLVLRSPKLNFTRKIASAEYFNGTLTWTDTVSEIRSIDVDLAISGYSYIIDGTSTLIKAPPATPITFVAVKYADMSTNDLLGPNQYQFIYRYIFVGNMRSVWSMASSTCAIPDNTYQKIILTLSPIEVQLADQYRGFITYIEIGARSDTTQPYRSIARIPFPQAKANSITLDFANDMAYPEIGTDETLQFYSNVPIRANAMEFAQNRYLFGGNTYGYDTVPGIGALSVTTTYSGNVPSDGGIYLLEGGKYYVGVVLYDIYDRRSEVYPLGAFMTQRRDGQLNYTKVSITLSGQLPSWANTWAPVVTRCTNKGIPLQVHIKGVTASSTGITFSSISFADPTPNGFAWVYNNGDKVSFLTRDAAGDAHGKPLYDLALTFDTSNGLFGASGDFTGFSDGAIAEFYVPIKEPSLEEYFEVGQRYLAYESGGNKYFGNNIPGNQFVFDLAYGDTFYLASDMCQRINLDPTRFNTWFNGTGRVNVPSITAVKQQVYGSEIAFSDVYIQGTSVNGLNSVQVDSKFSYSVAYGDIIKLTMVRTFQINGDVLLVTTPFNCYSVYLGKVQVFSNEGSTSLTTSDQLLGSANLLAGGYGSIHPESVHAYGTTAAGWDALKGIWWRYSQDGLTPLTMEYGMHGYAYGKSRQQNPTLDTSNNRIIGAFDPFFGERLLSIGDNTDGGNEILAFCEDKKGFSVFYDMNPDWICNINNMVVSWRKGALYLHNASDTYNTLHGIRVKSRLRVPLKPEKDWALTNNAISLWVYAQDQWSVSIEGIARTRNPVQTTVLDDWRETEDSFMAPIPLDTDKQYLKSRYFIADMSLDTDILSVFYGTSINMSESPQKS